MTLLFLNSENTDLVIVEDDMADIVITVGSRCYA